MINTSLLDLPLTIYRFTYRHTNHTTLTGVIKAFSIANRDTQVLSLLFKRYRRKLPIDNVVFELIEEK